MLVRRDNQSHSSSDMNHLVATCETTARTSCLVPVCHARTERPTKDYVQILMEYFLVHGRCTFLHAFVSQGCGSESSGTHKRTVRRCRCTRHLFPGTDRSYTTTVAPQKKRVSRAPPPHRRRAVSPLQIRGEDSRDSIRWCRRWLLLTGHLVNHVIGNSPMMWVFGACIGCGGVFTSNDQR